MAATYKSSSIKSKWKKTKWLLKDSRLKKYVPKTLPFSKNNLRSMLASYSTIYFKPTNGSGGNNIIRIKKKNRGYTSQLHTVKTFHKTRRKLYKELKRFTKKKNYLLQKGIRLARTKGKPFDIRVMVQKTNRGKWVSSALVTKIGKANKVATNYNQGGSIGYFRQTLAGAGYNKKKIRRIKKLLKRLGVRVGRNFDRHHKGFRELGLDVALNRKGRPWILEVNTRPQIHPLKKKKDKSIYKRILLYSKQYGRKQ